MKKCSYRYDCRDCDLLVCSPEYTPNIEDAFEDLQEHIRADGRMTHNERVRAQELLDELSILCYGEQKSF